MAEEQTLRYAAGSRTAPELQEAIVEIWSKVRADPIERAKVAKALGISEDQLPLNNPPVRIQQVGSGAGVVETVLIYLIAPVAIDIWKTFLLPKLKARFGGDALGREQKS